MPVQSNPSLPVPVKEAMQPAILTIGAAESLPAAVLLMQTLGVRRLLVLQAGRLVGLLTDGAVSRALPTLTGATTPWDYTFQAARLQVSEVMHRDLYTASPGDSLDQATHTLLEKHVGGLPVVDAHGRLVGLLTVTDVLRTALANPQPAWGTVGEHMSAEVIVAPPDAPLAEAAALLRTVCCSGCCTSRISGPCWPARWRPATRPT
jgi:CBS domain-containing protein